MAQCTRWGIAAALAVTIFSGCGGGDGSNPVIEGQSTAVRDMKFATGIKVPAESANIAGKSRMRLSELRGTVNPFAPAESMGMPTGELTTPRAGVVTGGLGAFRLEIAPDLNGRIVFPRTLQAQGDKYVLGVDQFFGSRNIQLRSIERAPDGTLDVSIAFSHPFPRPTDLTGPPTATKRLDLHIFNVWAGVLVQGTENYFAGDAITNTDALTNADTYRETGQLVDLPSGVTATVFPGKWVADQSAANTDPASDNYDPADHGWIGSELQDPRGYGVFPQGASVPVTFNFDPTANGGDISVDFTILADYQDPRATPAPKNNRLPDPLDPTKLRYILPYGAGDLQSISTTITDVIAGDPGSVETVTVDIIDLDADAPVVSGSFPNNANLNEMPFSSDISAVTTSFATAGITASAPLPGAGSGSGIPGSPKKYEFTLTNDGTAVDGEYTGMVRIVDEETANLDQEAYLNLDPSLAPIGTPLDIQAFQSVHFDVGVITPPGGAEIILDETISYVLVDDPGNPPTTPPTFGSWGSAPTPPQHPQNDFRAMSVTVEDESGTPLIGWHGLGSYGADPLSWGNGFLAAFNDDPATPAPDDFAIRGTGFANLASAANKSEPRSSLGRTWAIGDAYHDPAANPSTSVYAPYGANATAKGYWGITELVTLQIFPTLPAFNGRTAIAVFDDFDLWSKNNLQWGTDRANQVNLVLGDNVGTAGEPAAHAGGVEENMVIDVADSEFDRGTARDMTENDLGIFTALKAPYSPATQPTAFTHWQFWQLIDYDNLGSPFVENYSDTGTAFAANLPTFNSAATPMNGSDPSGPSMLGAGPGLISEDNTVAMDYSHSADRLYIADSADDSIEVYETLVTNSAEYFLIPNQEFRYANFASAAGVIVNPIDICVTQNDIVIVLDRGGASGGPRLVALDGLTLALLATRDIVVEADIVTGAISISADESLVNINDPSAFVLLWDNPEEPSVPGNDFKGGMNWYTVDLTP